MDGGGLGVMDRVMLIPFTMGAVRVTLTPSV